MRTQHAHVGLDPIQPVLLALVRYSWLRRLEPSMPVGEYPKYRCRLKYPAALLSPQAPQLCSRRASQGVCHNRWQQHQFGKLDRVRSLDLLPNECGVLKRAANGLVRGHLAEVAPDKSCATRMRCLLLSGHDLRAPLRLCLTGPRR